MASDIFVALAQCDTLDIRRAPPNGATKTPDKFRIATGSHVFAILTGVTLQSSMLSCQQRMFYERDVICSAVFEIK